MAEGQEKPNKINITVKTPKEKVTIEVEEDASIKDVSKINILLYKFLYRYSLYLGVI